MRSGIELRAFLHSTSIAVLVLAPLFQAALATPPPEEMPEICAQTICLLVTPQAPARVVNYYSRVDTSSGKQFLEARLNTGVTLHLVSNTLPRRAAAFDEPEFKWERRSDTLRVGSSCLLCSDASPWRQQAMGVAIQGPTGESVDAFLRGASIRLWSKGPRGQWNGTHYDVPLSAVHRVQLP